ncbi:MAG: hypothetical protein HYS06_11320 [Methylocystis sp.]|nr:hypothetical protein [Methylocystis sp.]MBI3275128.1 hypothetical protein [Methylocystis sp.]
MRSFFWFSIVFALLAAAPASAQGAAQQRSACTDDAYRLCEAQVPDAAAVEQCLRAHMSGLSRACRQEFAGPTKKTKKRARRR